MTTAREFRAAAAALAQVRDELGVLAQPVAVSAGDVVHGGPLERLLASAVEQSAHDVRTAIHQLELDVDEAHRRASVCDDYSRAVRDATRRPDAERRWPARPADWVEYG